METERRAVEGYRKFIAVMFVLVVCATLAIITRELGWGWVMGSTVTAYGGINAIQKKLISQVEKHIGG